MVVGLATETVSVSEGLARVKTSARSQTLETVAASEGVTRVKTSIKSLSVETVSISEGLDRIKNSVRLLTLESIAVSELLDKVKTAVRNLTLESASISEDLNSVKTANRSLTLESVAIDEALARIAIKSRLLTTEVVEITEDLYRTKIKNCSTPAETVVVSEALARIKSATRLLSEIVAIEELVEAINSHVFPVPEVVKSGGMGVPIIIQEGKTVTLDFVITHIEVHKDLSITATRSNQKSQQITITAKAPHAIIVPVIVKRINILIEGTRKTIHTDMLKIDATLQSSVIVVNTGNTTRNIV